MTDLDRVEQAYAAFARGDMNTLAEVLAPDVEWVVGGHNALTGTYRGKDELFGFLSRLLAATEGTFFVHLRTLAEPEPGLVLALVRLTAEAGGRAYDEVAVQQVEVRHGQVVSCRTFTQSSRSFDELVGPAVITLPDAGRVAARTA